MELFQNHSSIVSLDFNITTGYTTSQFHVVHNKSFTTIYNFNTNNLGPFWYQLIIICRSKIWWINTDNFRK